MQDVNDLPGNSSELEDGTAVIEGQLCRRHVNQNGKLGGWVALTASVAETVFVEKDALVLDCASVQDSVKLFGHARVYGHARLRERVKMYDYSQAHGDVVLSGGVRLCDYAELFGGVLAGDRVQFLAHARVGVDAIFTGDAWVIASEATNRLTVQYAHGRRLPDFQ